MTLTMVDYEQSLFFLIVRRERSEKNRPRESWWQGRRKNVGTRRSRVGPSPIKPCQEKGNNWQRCLQRLIRFEMNTTKSLGRERSNAEALPVVPLFSPALPPTFARPVFFAPLSTDYTKKKEMLVVYNDSRWGLE